jgi:asparagine synthase (glutamine-hydrolysing)
MSGICGICEPHGVVPGDCLDRMLTSLTLSGEEQSESVSNRSTALGVVRKWPGQQAASVQGVRIAIDADLNNASELRGMLQVKEVDASGIALAEVLAWHYVISGPDFIEKLEGAFAIALWDETEQRLLLAIDRFGLRSLYWRREGERLLFASRSSAILAVQDEPPEANLPAVTQFLIFSVVPAPLSIYRGIERLNPGTRLMFEQGRLKQYQYWDASYPEGEEDDVTGWSRQVREELRAAVQRHLNGCTAENSGAYLSGGTDSSTVVAFMSECLRQVNTFSIYFSETPYSEIGFAHTTAEKFRTHHLEKCLMPEDASAVIPKLTEYYDEPFGNSSAVGAYYCARLARENGIETLLAGDGGDEIFAGNSRYADDKRFALYQSIPLWIRRGLIEPVARMLPSNDGWLSLAPRYIRRAKIPNPMRIFSYSVFLSLDPQEVFEGDFLEQAAPSNWMEIADRHFHAPRAASELNRQMYLDLKMVLADNDLRKVNGTAELSGVQVRYPMLDRKLVELAGRVPARLKLKGFEKRYIFKQAMRGILPDEVLFKKKHGFGVPLGIWLLRDPQLKSLVQDVLNDSRTRQRGYFRRDFYDRVLELQRTDHAAFYGEVVWYLVALELWHRQHLDRFLGVQLGK